jgi:multicomponent Na+:H+ antiporter subunit G
MSIVTEIVTWVALVLGSGFAIVGAIGLLRLPDFYTRIHAAGVTDTMGAALVLIGCAVQSGLNLVTVKLAMIWVFIYLTGPAATHALGKAAYAAGVQVRGHREDRRSVVPL